MEQDNCPICVKSKGFQDNHHYIRDAVGQWQDANTLTLKFNNHDDGTLTANASIQQIAPNATLHSIDEVADYFHSLPSPPKGFGQVFVDHSGRVFIRTMIAMPGVNRHGWGLDEKYIPNNIDTIHGVPLTFAMQKKQEAAGDSISFPHPGITDAHPEFNQNFQKAYTIGYYISREAKPDANKVWHGISEVTNGKAKAFFTDIYQTKKQNLIPMFVSPQVLHYEDQNRANLQKWWFQHITITDNPAYPKEFAQITASCVGDDKKCIPELRQASMDKLFIIDKDNLTLEDAKKRGYTIHKLTESDKNADIESLKQVAENYKRDNTDTTNPTVTQIVNADSCPICVTEALKSIIYPSQDNSSLITKSASFSQDEMTENNSNSGGSNTTTETLGSGALSTGQTGDMAVKTGVSEERNGALQTISKKEEIENPKQQQGYSAELDAKNLPEQITKLIQGEISKYLGSIVTNREKTEVVGKPAVEEKKVDEVAELKAKLQKDEKAKADAAQAQTNKNLLEKLDAQEKTIKKLNDAERRRKIEMTLLTFREGKQFLNPETKEFDEARFKKQVDHWMKTELEADKVEEQLNTMVELLGPLAENPVVTEKGKEKTTADKTEPSPKRAYASNDELEADVETPIFKNKNSEIETETASMDGILDEVPYYVKLERKTVLRSNQLGEVVF